MVDSGSWYIHERWPHDGHPVSHGVFVVYSDAASPEAREEMAAAAVRVWSEILEELSIDPDELQFPPGSQQIDIYAYHGHFPQGWSGRAYYGGLLIWAPDHPFRRFDAAGYEPVLKHELIHVVQWMVTGGRGTFDTWFVEGLPLAMAQDLSHQPVRDLERFRVLTEEYGSINPISIERYSQITDPDIGEHYFYPMFQLTFEYLLDRDGMGRTPADIRDIMLDTAEGTPFEQAFEVHMGLALDDFERDFFELMDAYLR
jgi:hypothetical protein